MKRFAFAMAVLGMVLSLAAPVLAGGGPENVAVVVNSDSWASKAVANEYIRLRNIPACNVVYLPLGKLSDFENVSIDVFRSTILLPALKELDARKLSGQIDYITWSSDIPWGIEFSSDVGKQPLPQPYKYHTGSINGLTYLYPLVLTKAKEDGTHDFAYLSPEVNAFARRPIGSLPPLPLSQEDTRLWSSAGAFMKDGQFDKAQPIIENILTTHPEAVQLHLMYTYCLAAQDKLDDAVKAFDAAVTAGFADQAAFQDPMFAKLLKRDGFDKIVKRMQDLALQPTIGFHSSNRFDIRGSVVNDVHGQRYLLSTVLGITSGRGNSVAEVIQCLHRSAGADGSAPKGTFYFMGYMKDADRRDRTTCRAGLFGPAAAKIKALGYNAEVADAILPAAKADCMGIMAGTAQFDWPATNSTILPGAICENLTSWAGIMNEDAGQTPLSAWIRAGASGTSGAVAEPYALQQKFPLAFMHLHYAKGCSLAEAYYQSVTGPYQLLIVGDGLCQPYAKFVKVSITGVKDGQTVKGKLQLGAKVADSKDSTISQLDLFVDGRRVGRMPAGAKCDMDTTQLSDGYHEFRMVATDNTAIQTQSRNVIGVIVNNKGQSVKLAESSENFMVAPQHSSQKPVCYSDELRLVAQAKGTSKIVIQANGREITPIGIDDRDGAMVFDTTAMGTGPVRFQAIATFGEAAAATQVRSQPLDVQIVMPPAAEPIAAPAGTLTAGFKLVCGDATPSLIKDTLDQSWPVKAGVPDKTTFTIDGYYNAPKDNVYQLQVFFDGQIKITSGDFTRNATAANGWVYVPMALKKGYHHLVIEATPKGTPTIGIRFGAEGVLRIEHEFQTGMTAQ